MSKQKFSLYAGAIGVAAIIATLAAGPSAMAAPSTSSTALPVPSAAAQGAYASQVNTFIASHPAPAPVAATSGVAAQDSYWSAETTFWKAVPWDAVAGQWGCTVQSVSVQRDATPDAHGVTGAGYSMVTNCGSAATSATINAATTPVTKASLIAVTPALSALKTTAVSALAVPTPNAYASQGCGSSGNTSDCLYSNFAEGMNKATVEWTANSNVTGRARLGKKTAGDTCTEGTLVSNSDIALGNQYSVWTTAHSVSTDQLWSSAFVVSGAVYSKYCATF